MLDCRSKDAFGEISYKFANHLLLIGFGVVHRRPNVSKTPTLLIRLSFFTENEIGPNSYTMGFGPVQGSLAMDEEVVEFSVAHNRKYSRDHLWYQEKDDRLMIGVSEFLAVEIGEVLRVILPQAEYEIDEGRDMFSIWTAEEKVAFPSLYSGIIAEVNGEVEINPDLVNDSAYDHGWIIIIEPHEMNLENLLDPDEYVEFLAEL
ncbi:MAG: hypothetical protein CL988_05775 [Euryarchaeota archaeon]|nr:hypothetical protein [Euryarchaeota archaeon]